MIDRMHDLPVARQPTLRDMLRRDGRSIGRSGRVLNDTLVAPVLEAAARDSSTIGAYSAPPAIKVNRMFAGCSYRTRDCVKLSFL
jgi:hypothetical protein